MVCNSKDLVIWYENSSAEEKCGYRRRMIGNVVYTKVFQKYVGPNGCEYVKAVLRLHGSLTTLFSK